MRPDYPIRTERLLLRPFTGADLDALHSWQSREDVVRYLYGGVRTLEESADQLMSRAAVTWPSKAAEELSLAVELDGEVVGEAVLKWLSEEHRQGEIGYVLHPDHHGRGIAVEASEALLRLAFEGLGLHRVIAQCDPRNTASWRVMEKLGMRREAHLRHCEVFKGEWGDVYTYALLEDEWSASSGT
ncbi:MULTISPECIES: GNAT family N-acetyltransferase [Actinosynnema]|uniref:GNAT family N-acetyltransferase n=1 Tax=Actinosynnema TaxID=40566 RepID=UPI0020A61783|nr:GNAT family protein [Actinosynnema pretiosum]